MAGDPQERMLEAAINLLERHGVDGVGIREIAAEAGVNSAAVSYYFRSKENLMRQALERTLDQAFGRIPGELEALAKTGLGKRQAFEALLAGYIANASRYPRISYAHLREAITLQRYDTPGAAMVQKLISELAQWLKPEYPKRTEAELRLGLSQIWAAIITWAMAPGLFAGVAQVDLQSPADCQRWSAQMLCLLDGPRR